MSKSILFDPKAWEEYLYWQSNDRKTLKKINQLLQDITRNPYDGLGKPEPLTGSLVGAWSRRIDDKKRLIYEIINNAVQVTQCRAHYEDK